jgi:hypothetical protein
MRLPTWVCTGRLLVNRWQLAADPTNNQRHSVYELGQLCQPASDFQRLYDCADSYRDEGTACMPILVFPPKQRVVGALPTDTAICCTDDCVRLTNFSRRIYNSSWTLRTTKPMSTRYCCRRHYLLISLSRPSLRSTNRSIDRLISNLDCASACDHVVLQWHRLGNVEKCWNAHQRRHLANVVEEIVEAVIQQVRSRYSMILCGWGSWQTFILSLYTPLCVGICL